MSEELSAEFIRTIHDLYGEAGETWLREMPARIASYERRWNLAVHPPFGGLSYNYVAPATMADGTPAVFKLGVPAHDMLPREFAALRHYDGRGMARLLEHDVDDGALLLERLLPGTQLASMEDDEQATQIAAEVIRDLLRPAPPEPHPFPNAGEIAESLRDLRREFHGGTGPYSPRMVETAEALFRDLLASQGPPMLVHADLHHYNILAASRAPWLAIDPQGVIAEAEFEVGALLRNPNQRIPHMANLDRVMARRIDILHDVLGFDRQRMASWGFAQALVSAWWTYEDHGEIGEDSLLCAEALAKLL